MSDGSASQIEAARIVQIFQGELGELVTASSLDRLQQLIAHALDEEALQACERGRWECLLVCERRAEMWQKSYERIGSGPDAAREEARARFNEAQVLADEIRARMASADTRVPGPVQ